jgi:hypothetical protein
VTAHTQSQLHVRVTPELREVHLMAGAAVVAVGLSESNASRLAAAWNACEGTSTDELVGIVMLEQPFAVLIGGMQRERAALQAQIDLLRASLDLMSTVNAKANLARADRDAAFALLREMLEGEDKVTALLGATFEPGYVGRMRALLEGKS